MVLFKHVLKNAMIPIITNVVLEIPFLYTGSLLLENFFGIPGLGGMTVQALANSDFPVIKSMTYFGSLLYVLFNLISDLCYAFVDPRIDLE
jgi:peptide/nickel transport system permease protein